MGLHRATGNTRGCALCYYNLGVVAFWKGAYARAAELTRTGESLFRELGDLDGTAYAMENPGAWIARLGDAAGGAAAGRGRQAA